MNNNLGKILVDLREKKNYTQKDLANKLNVSDKAVSRWETGMSIPHVETLVRISKLFKINLQDLIIAAAACEDNDDKLVEDIIKEFTQRDENKTKLIKIILSITLIVILILTITIIFTKTYNRFKVYNVYIESDFIKPSTGIYVETRIKDSLYIENIKIRNYEAKKNDTVIIDLYYLENDKEYILQTYTKLEDIHFVNSDSYIEINDLSNYKDRLYIKVRIINDSQEINEYVGKLEFVLDFSNNKIFYDENKEEINETKVIKLSPIEIKNILLENGYKEDNNVTMKIKLKNGYIFYYLDSNLFIVYFEEQDFYYKYIYKLNLNLLQVIIYNKNNIEIEDYEYDITNNKVINCIIGKCNNYDKAIKFLNENILIYFS